MTSRGIAVPMANGNVMMLPLPEEADEVDGGNGTSGNLAGMVKPMSFVCLFHKESQQ